MKTAVAFIIFRRADTATRVFEEIRRARPPRLYVIGDGPRPDRPGEAEEVAAVRAVVDHVDWPCEVIRIFSEENLGCKQRIYSGLNEVFTHEEEAIILEDDCLPDPTFFTYCEELLKRYRDEPRIMAISGNNFQGGHRRTRYSYFFSMYPHIWGWATWRRAWKLIDINLDSYTPQPCGKGWARDIHLDKELEFWTQLFGGIQRKEIEQQSWDYPWNYTCFYHQGLSAYPEVPLVQNIGIGSEATHTFDIPRVQLAPRKPLHKIKHPPTIERCAKADDFSFQAVFQWQEMVRWRRWWSHFRIFAGKYRRKLFPDRQESRDNAS